MALGNVVDQLHDEHRLAHAGTAEQAYLAALHVRLQQIDDLDARSQDFLLRGKLLKLGGGAVDGIGTLHVELFHTVDGLTDNVQHTTLDLVSGGHQDGRARGDCFQATMQAVGVVHGHAAHSVFADVLLHLDD